MVAPARRRTGTGRAPVVRAGVERSGAVVDEVAPPLPPHPATSKETTSVHTMRAMARVGILTGGGDCPGLNAVIRGVVRKAVKVHGSDAVGFRYGWSGVVQGDAVPLDLVNTSGILPRGGTVLGSSRTNPYAMDGGVEKVKETLAVEAIDMLIPIGGEDTLGVARRLSDDGIVPIVGVPKTIDNDLSATDFTFGFQTAVQIVTDAIDRLHTTAESHNRVMVVEVMGRSAGHIALWSGMAGGADAILVPERPFDIDEVVAHIRQRHARGKTFSIVVVAEGAQPAGEEITTSQETDAFGHARLGGIGVYLEGELRERTGYDARATILGHVQRGGTPTAFDRVLATRFGVAAIDAAMEGDFGKMVALRAQDIIRVPLADALAESKLVDPDLYATAETFFG
jgi:ATP-dependent phosphofructokinase / diphosphate-dependent phosphofructokinase